MDLLVVSTDKLEYWRDTPGSVHIEAASEGRILHEAVREGPRQSRLREESELPERTPATVGLGL